MAPLKFTAQEEPLENSPAQPPVALRPKVQRKKRSDVPPEAGVSLYMLELNGGAAPASKERIRFLQALQSAATSVDSVVLHGATGSGRLSACVSALRLRTKQSLAKHEVVVAHDFLGQTSTTYSVNTGLTRSVERIDPAGFVAALSGTTFGSPVVLANIDALPASLLLELSARLALVDWKSVGSRPFFTAATSLADMGPPGVRLAVYAQCRELSVPPLHECKADIVPSLERAFARVTGHKLAWGAGTLRRFITFAHRAAWPHNFLDVELLAVRLKHACPDYQVLPAAVEALTSHMSSWSFGPSRSRGATSPELEPAPGKGRIPERANPLQRIVPMDWENQGHSDLVLAQRLLGVGILSRDRVEMVQLEAVLHAVVQSDNMAQAGRSLYRHSRQLKKAVNDTTRLKQTLARWGLSYDEVREKLLGNSN